MMRPLKEGDGTASPIEADAIELLRVAVGHEPVPGQKQRVRAKLFQHRGIRRAARFRPSVAVAIVLCGAVASASVGRHWIARTVHSLATPAAPQPEASTVARAPRPLGEGGSAGDGPPAGLGSGVAMAGPAKIVPLSRSARLSRTSRLARSAKPSEISREPAVPPASDDLPAPAARDGGDRASRPDDIGLVFDAMQALRLDHAPARATRWLDEYLSRHPAGPLAEEALALSIEAARMSGDPRARDLVNQYLSRYPHGHFRSAVDGHRAQQSP